MNICTITCHDVYNVGASLQAYALCTYLRSIGHDATIIDYKPDYLSRHYSLSWVNNPRFDKPLVRELFLLAKLPSRLKARRSERKKRFDAFREIYLPLTKRYGSFEELRFDPPKADVYIAGSDQIWNPLFKNGKDPAFFLQFAPQGTKRVSYAASFAGDQLSNDDRERMTPWLQTFDAVSVREKSGMPLLKSMDVDGIAVCDPVFLLTKEEWNALAISPKEQEYIFVYDFENNAVIRELAMKLREQTGKPIVSVFESDYADKVINDLGPQEFVGAIAQATTVISNSFHATAFSLILHRDCYVVGRSEGINARMVDLLESVGLSDRLVSTSDVKAKPIDWDDADDKLAKQILFSKRFLEENI